MKAIILCAGKGERLKPLTENIPKPMVDINNKPVLEYFILLCKKHRINEIAINTSYIPEKIKNYFGDGSKFGVKIKYSFEPKLLGTAGALNNFRDFLTETFFVIYGDNLTNLNLSKMLRYHRDKKAVATLYIYREKMINEKTSIGCVVIDENNKIMEIIENPNKKEKKRIKKIPEKRKFINAGIYIFEPEVLQLIQKGYSNFSYDIFPKMLELNKPLYGYQEDCYFKEIGQMLRYSKAKQDIESGKIKLNL